MKRILIGKLKFTMGMIRIMRQIRCVLQAVDMPADTARVVVPMRNYDVSVMIKKGLLTGRGSFTLTRYGVEMYNKWDNR
jgi:hypothetical protein